MDSATALGMTVGAGLVFFDSGFGFVESGLVFSDSGFGFFGYVNSVIVLGYFNSDSKNSISVVISAP